MPRFRFALDPLLKARQMAEQSHQRTVAQIERQRLDLEGRIRQQQQVIGADKQSLRSNLIGLVKAHELRLHAAAAMHSMRIAQRLVLELAGVHRRLEAARAELIEATRARRAIELLRERRLHEWRTAVDKAETAALDELAVIAAARSSRTGMSGMPNAHGMPAIGPSSSEHDS